MTLDIDFQVNGKTVGTQIELTGVAGPPLQLRTLTINHSNNPPPETTGKLKESSTTGTLTASLADWTTLSNMLQGAPFDMTIFATDLDNGWVQVQSLGFEGGLVRALSDVHEIRTATADLDLTAHSTAAQVLAEIRQLNSRVASIERLLHENVGVREAATGTRR